MRRKYIESAFFKKKIDKLRGQERINVLKKVEEILTISDLNHYKNLKKKLKRFKRVHVNKSYIILFLGNDDKVYFIDYDHHDKIYKKEYRHEKFD